MILGSHFVRSFLLSRRNCSGWISLPYALPDPDEETADSPGGGESRWPSTSSSVAWLELVREAGIAAGRIRCRKQPIRFGSL